MMINFAHVTLGVAATLAGQAIYAGVIEVDLITGQGMTPPGIGGATVSSVNPPFTNGNGQVGFTGNLSTDAGTDGYVWFDNGIIWRNSDSNDITLTGNEATSGISDAGGFIYSPSADGNDSVWTHEGLLLRGTDPLPGSPGLFSTFNSRPRMLVDGTAVWIGGYSDTSGGSTQGRVLLRASDPADPLTITQVISTGDTVDGFQITSTGIGFAYDFSKDGNHHIHNVLVNAPSASDEFVYVDGDLIVREGDPVGDGTTWNTFRMVSINNKGNYAFAGNTNGGPTAEREFLAINGQIALRRGDIVGGVELASNWVCQAVSINNLNQVAHLWKGGSGSSATGALFIGDIDDLANSVAVLQVGDMLDTTGDRSPDYVIDAFPASATIAPGLDFSDHPWIYTHLDVTHLGTGDDPRVIVRVGIPGVATCPGDLNGDSNVNVADLLLLLGEWGPCGDPQDCPGDLNNDDVVNVADLLLLLGVWGPCPR